MLLTMRTTLSLDPDVLETVRALATQRGTSIGAVLSDLARRGLRSGTAPDRGSRNGIPLLPIGSDSQVVTPDLVASILDEA
jgi:hypothetical protein